MGYEVNWRQTMTKVEAIRKLMEDNGGVAAWRYIYDNIEKYYPQAKSAKAWQQALRGTLYREINKGKNFKSIGLKHKEPVFALIEYEHEKQLNEIKQDPVRMHSYIEGIMVELGNCENFDTYCADPSAMFQKDIPISQIATIARADFPQFTDPKNNEIAKRIDVIWFNKIGYKFPQKVIEVVDSISTLSEALSRMYQLKNCNVRKGFLVLHPQKDRPRVESMLEREPYSSWKEEISLKNYDYDYILNHYNARLELEKHPL